MAKLSSQEDRQLIDKARDGDRQAFSRLVEKYEPVVAATTIGMLGPGEDAEDVGQNVFIRFYKALDDFRGDAALGTYLTRIAINLSLNELKRRQRRRFLFLKSSDIEQDVGEKQWANPESALDAKEAVNKALQQLEPRYRSVVVLRMIQGYPTKETAKILNLPLGTVLSRLSRAQEKLKEYLKNLIE